MKKNICVLLLLVWSLGSSAQQKTLLMVVPPSLYHDTEFADPMNYIELAEINVSIASTKIGEIKGVQGNSIYASTLLKDVKVKNYDAICIMGGKGTGQYLWENEELKNLIIKFHQKKKLVTGICAGSVCLAKAGVLKGIAATTYPVNGFIKQLEENGALYTKNSVCVDENIITANGPAGAKAFGIQIVKYLHK